MKVIRESVLMLILIMTGVFSYAQDNLKENENRNSGINNYQMKNCGMIPYQRRVPDCNFVKNGNDPERIICMFEEDKKRELSQTKTKQMGFVKRKKDKVK